ncbi:MAG: U32 family peptidase [Candidatus Rifleibacteriota bacterium]
MSKKHKPELMAPAGDMLSLRAAIDAGADAIYFGIASMNMRSSAKNFSADQLAEVVAQCHQSDVKAYLALNTIVYDHELKKAEKLIKEAVSAGIDAIICWDFAIIDLVLQHKAVPFISTQMSVANSRSIAFLYKHFGIKRFVLARECTLDEIKTLKEELNNMPGNIGSEIEIEVFAHGAMCVSLSGRCFMSEFHFGKSGNRGECKQPCRREYKITEIRDGKSFLIGSNYVMSPKDLCSLPFIDKVFATGIDSLKIEGRGRSPEYVSTVTSCYRRAIDYYFANHEKENFNENFKELKTSLVKELKSVFNRGFSEGFLFGRPVTQWTSGNGSKATHRKVQVGIVTNFFKKPMVAEIKVEGHSFKPGDTLMFQGNKTGVKNLTVESIEIEQKPVEMAERNSFVGVKLAQEVRRNDKVYMIVPVEEVKEVQQ